MPNASYSLTDNESTPNTTVYYLSGATATGASYRDSSRTLSLPRDFSIAIQQTPIGSKSNDKVVVIFRNTVTDDLGNLGTGFCKLELSLPKNSTWTHAMSTALLAHMESLLGVGPKTLIDYIAKGIIL